MVLSQRSGGGAPQHLDRSWLLAITLVVAPTGLLGSGLSGLASGELGATLENRSAQIWLTRMDNRFVGGILRVLYL